MRRLTVTACLALALGASACGTTVPLTQTATGPQSSAEAGTGLSSVPGGGTAPSYQAQAPGSGTAVAGGGAGSASTGALANGGSGAGSVAGPVGALTSARGVTTTTITIGVPVPSDTSAVAASLGIQGAGTISPQAMIAAVVNDVNKSGGVLGRKLVVYEHSYSAASYISNPSQVDGEICADFRDDHKVFAILFDLVDPYVRQCSAAMGAPLVVVGGIGSYMPAAAYRGDFLFAPTGITAERLAHLFVQSLMQRDFTHKWNIATGGPGVAPVRLGLIHADSPDQNAYYAAYAKELAKYGLRFTDTVTYAANVQAGLAATQSAVLKFRADGISHVFGASAFFLEDAESQKYYPRYAYIPGLGQLGVANVPADQLKGALTVGWAPANDVDSQHDPGDTPGAKHCRKVMAAAGLSTASRSDLTTMYMVCDAAYALRAALTAGRVATVPGLRTGFEALGAGFPTALTFKAVLNASHHYGLDSVRDMAFDSACGCLKYTSRTDRS